MDRGLEPSSRWPASPGIESCTLHFLCLTFLLFYLFFCQIMTPVVKLLRLMDGEKPAMGKVYELRVTQVI